MISSYLKLCWSDDYRNVSFIFLFIFVDPAWLWCWSTFTEAGNGAAEMEKFLPEKEVVDEHAAPRDR